MTKPVYISANSPYIQAILNNSKANRYTSYDTALARIMEIRSKYIVCNAERIPYNVDNEIVLFVKHYKNEELLSQGYLGNFVKIHIESYAYFKNKFFKLSIQDINDIPLKNHPLRNQEVGNRLMPNWGNPVLRRVRKGIEFDSKKEAEAFINQLTEKYPKTVKSATGLDGVMALVFSGHYKKKHQSIIFSATAKENGKYFISYWENNYNRKMEFKFYSFGFDMID